MTVRSAVPVLLALVLAASLAPAASAGSPSRRYVAVGEFFLKPNKLTVSRGTRIVWRWRNQNRYDHDINLRSGPKGVKHFSSKARSRHYSFGVTLDRRGTYRVYCSFHPLQMRETITVR